MADRGSYFVTTLNRTKEKEKKKKKKYRYNAITTKLSQAHVILSLKEKAFGLYSKKDMNWKSVSLPIFQPLLNLLQS